MRDHRKERLWAKYRLTVEGYETMLLNQGGGCALCGSVKHLEVDHDHSCCPGEKTCGGCIRGILCRKCNTVLGRIGDSQQWLADAGDYLRGIRYN